MLASHALATADLLSASNYPSHIPVQRIRSDEFAPLEELQGVLGLSVRLCKDGSVDAFALATPYKVFQVGISKSGAPYATPHLARVFLWPGYEEDYDENHDDASKLGYALDGYLLTGFGMARLALHLQRQFGVHVRGVELSTLLKPGKTTSPSEFVEKSVSGRACTPEINALWYQNGDKDLCLRAWVSAICADGRHMQIVTALKVDTRHLTHRQLACMSQLVVNVELLEAERPSGARECEFDGVRSPLSYNATKEDVVVQNERFKTRLRKSKQTMIILETADGTELVGRAVRAQGRQTGIKFTNSHYDGKVNKIKVIGREESTNAERTRDEFVLDLLQGRVDLTNSDFTQMFWFPTSVISGARTRAAYAITSNMESFSELNPSQRDAAAAMLQDDEPIVTVQGPPGTGKTSTIAAALEYWAEAKQPVWVVAQSNVGVKNIARSLEKRENKFKFKLIVSQEFHFEWHEHLYEKLRGQVILSDELFSVDADVPRMLDGATVILCTLSMLSNSAMDGCGMFRYVPMTRLVVDEASQIDTFEFMHLFHKFRSSLKKMCLFGDPKQLPPYGQETAPEMKTVFDFQQFKSTSYFLDTQYRMPVPLGEFISKHIYGSKLHSQHAIKDMSCVAFVDVRKGEEEFAGASWKNTEEVRAVVRIVKQYYRHKKFCIITPYDAQRAAIARQLKIEGLPDEHVYNVDSFQGHDEDYVIVSAVRTESAGFLRSLNRINVMLTRCKRGMVVVTQRAFLAGPGRATLLGKLSVRWADAWVDSLQLSDARASLPGVSGRARFAENPSAHSASWRTPPPASGSRARLVEADGHPSEHSTSWRVPPSDGPRAALSSWGPASNPTFAKVRFDAHPPSGHSRADWDSASPLHAPDTWRSRTRATPDGSSAGRPRRKVDAAALGNLGRLLKEVNLEG